MCVCVCLCVCVCECSLPNHDVSLCMRSNYFRFSQSSSFALNFSDHKCIQQSATPLIVGSKPI